MLLTAFDVLWPVAGAGPLVVQKTADAQLFRGRAVPAGPVPGARRLVAENAIEPVAVLSRNRWIRLTFPVAIVRSPGIVAALGHATMLPSENKTVRAVEQFWTPVDALPITIAVLDVANHSGFRLTRVFLLLLLGARSC